MALRVLTVAALSLAGTWNFSGTVQKDGVDLATTAQVGIVKCVAMPTGNVADLASGAPLSVDGVTVQDGDTVLLNNQTDKSENGFYTVTDAGSGSDGQWDRHTSFDADAEVTVGIVAIVTGGANNRGLWNLVAFNGTIDTDDIEFDRYDEGAKVTIIEATATSGQATNGDYELAVKNAKVISAVVNGVPQMVDTVGAVSSGTGSDSKDEYIFSSGNRPTEGSTVELIVLYRDSGSFA